MIARGRALLAIDIDTDNFQEMSRRAQEPTVRRANEMTPADVRAAC